MNVGAARVCLERHVLTQSIRTIASVRKDTQDMIVRQVSLLQFISKCHFIKYVHIITWYYDTRCCNYSFVHLDIKTTKFSVTFSAPETRATRMIYSSTLT